MKRTQKILAGIVFGVFCVPFISQAQTLQSYSYTNSATTSAGIQLTWRGAVGLPINCEANPITISSVKIYGHGNGNSAVYTRAKMGNTYSDTVIIPSYTSHRAATSTYTFSTPVDCTDGTGFIQFETANATSGAYVAYLLGRATSTTDGTGWCMSWDLGSGTDTNNSSCQVTNKAWNYEIWGTPYVAPNTGGSATTTVEVAEPTATVQYLFFSIWTFFLVAYLTYALISKK